MDTNRIQWDAAFAAFTAASAADAAINAEHKEATANGQDAPEALDDECNRLCDVMVDAAFVLLTIPAPDRAALLWKSEYLFGECTTESTSSPCWAGRVVADYMADVRRLLAQEV